MVQPWPCSDEAGWVNFFPTNLCVWYLDASGSSNLEPLLFSYFPLCLNSSICPAWSIPSPDTKSIVSIHTQRPVWSQGSLFPQGYIFGSLMSDLPHLEMEAYWLPGLSGGSVWSSPVVLTPHGDSAVDSWGLWDSAFFPKPEDENAQHCSYPWDSLTSHQSCEKGRNLSVSQAWKAFCLLHNSFLIFQKSYLLRELCLPFPLLWRPLSSTVVLWIDTKLLERQCFKNDLLYMINIHTIEKLDIKMT